MSCLDFIGFVALVILASFWLAKVEINIEGAHGYAELLPVEWRTNNKWMRLFFTGTSYHLYMGLFLTAIVHLGFILGWDWTLGREMLVLSWLAFVTVAEDFLWFVLNPHFGIKKFKRECIPWFNSRWFIVPLWYWWYLGAGIVLYYFGIKGG